MKKLTIGSVAKEAHVNIDTVRYYERQALIPRAERKESGYRIFTEDIIARIKFIKRAQELGFTLREIKELLNLRVSKNKTCHDVKQRAEEKIADIENKVNELRKMQNALTILADQCHGNGPTSTCPILDALEKNI